MTDFQSDVEDVLPATPAQAGMLFETVSAAGSSVNQGLLYATLPQDLDVDRFMAAWQTCISRHQCLRSHFLWEGLSAPVLVIRKDVEVNWDREDWRGLGDVSGKLAELADRYRRIGLDITVPPSMRLSLFDTDAGFQFVWHVHHAIIDDWSMDVILRETQLLYQGNQNLDAAMPFRAFADYLATQNDEADSKYWSGALQGLEEPTKISLARPAASAGLAAAHVLDDMSLTSEQSDALFGVARDLRATIGSVLTMAWAITLHRLADTDDMVFGLATTQRAPELQGVEQAVGNFVATQPLRMNLDPNATLRDAITGYHSKGLSAQGRAAPVLPDLVGALGFPQGTGLFDSILSIKQPEDRAAVQHLYRDVSVDYHSSFPVAVIVRPGSLINVSVLADPVHFDARARTLILEMMIAALAAFPAALDAPWKMLSVLPRSPLPDLGTPLPSHVPLLGDAIAAQQPTRIAVHDETGDVTYRAFLDRAEVIASQLHSNGIGKGDRVAVLLDRGATCLATYFAAWRVGAAYIPLDPAQGPARLQSMLNAGAPKLVLTEKPLRPLLDDTGFNIQDIDLKHKGDCPGVDLSGDDIAYIMFTSGSTGTPKGVVVSHDNLAASTAARSIWYKDTPERYMVVSPFGFDSSVAGTFWTLSTGGTLIVPPANDVQDPVALSGWVTNAKVTHTLCLPSLYDVLLQTAKSQDLSSLRCVIVAGEAPFKRLVQDHKKALPNARLVNEYGPTEATVWCAAYELSSQDDIISIGRAIPGTELVIKDENGRAVPDGLPGEVWVTGAGVAKGYLGSPEATVAAFIQDGEKRYYKTGDFAWRLPDGNLVLTGRKDQQVKIRGARIELGEVEAELQKIDGVTLVATVAVPLVTGVELVCYYTGSIDEDAFVSNARTNLSAAMMPRFVSRLDQMPLTPTGKIDNRSLTSRGVPQVAQNKIPPEGATEIALAKIWADIIGLPEIPDVTLGFFELGGDSLKAMRLVGRIAEDFDRRVAVADVLTSANTIRKLAQTLEKTTTPDNKGGHSYPIVASKAQTAIWLAARMNANEPFFNLSKAARISKTVTMVDLEHAAARLEAHHDILGISFLYKDRCVWLDHCADKIELTLDQTGQDALDKTLNRQAKRPFDMMRGRLWRLASIDMGDGTSVVQLNVHHAICDGWSLDLLMRDLTEFLVNPTADRAKPASTFADHLGNTPTKAPQSVERYSEVLGNIDQIAVLQADNPVPSRASSEGTLLYSALSTKVSNRVKTTAQNCDTTVFNVLWACLGLTLQEMTGKADSIVAVSHANRQSADEMETVGCFVKALPYRLNLSGIATFDMALDQARTTSQKLATALDVELEDLTLPSLSDNRTYLASFAQIALQYNDFNWSQDATSEDVKPIAFEPNITSAFEVSLEWSWRNDVLTCAILARKDLFAEPTLTDFLRRYCAKVEQVMSE